MTPRGTGLACRCFPFAAKDKKKNKAEEGTHGKMAMNSSPGGVSNLLGFGSWEESSDLQSPVLAEQGWDGNLTAAKPCYHSSFLLLVFQGILQRNGGNPGAMQALVLRAGL